MSIPNKLTKAIIFTLLIILIGGISTCIITAKEIDDEFYYRLVCEIRDSYDKNEFKYIDYSGEMVNSKRLVSFLSAVIPYQFNIKATGYSDKSRVEYSWQYKADIDKRYNEGLAIAKKVVSENIKSEMSAREKIKVLHDWVVNKNNYPSKANSIDVFSPTQLFLYGNTVCSGYSRAIKILCDLAGIPCIEISGSTSTSEHSWNLVYIDNEWMHLDATYDDPIGRSLILDDYFLLPLNSELRTCSLSFFSSENIV